MQTKGKFTAVEVALCPEFGFNYILPECIAKYQATGDKRYRISSTRFVFLTDNESGYTQMFLMTIVPRASYLESTRFRPFRKMAYLKRDKEFSGLIFFHHANGAFANGWAYEKGKIISPMSFVSESDPEYVLTRNTCMTSITYLVTTCGSWSTQAGEYEFTGSECTSEVVTDYYYSTCGDGGYSGSTGGGSYNDDGYNSQIETRDPCATRNALSSSTSLNNRIDNLSSKVSSSPSSKEDGWIRTSSDEYIYPNSATTGGMRYLTSDVQGKTFMENFHAHPAGGSMYPSWGDLKALSTWYNEGHIDASNYIYGVVSDMGIMVLTIAHEGTFREFAEDAARGDQAIAKRDFDDFYNLARGSRSPEDTVCKFITFLNEIRSGLQILYKPNGAFGKPEWFNQWKVLKMESGSSLSSNCNQ